MNPEIPLEDLALLEPFYTLFTGLFNQLISCFGIDGTDFDIKPGILYTFYSVIKDIIVKAIGYIFIQFMKLYKLPVKLLKAVSKALAGSIAELEKIVAEIVLIYNKIMLIITDTVAWIMANFLEFYENFIIPLGPFPDFSIDIPGVELPSFNIPLPPNKLYRDILNGIGDINWLKFNPSAILKFIGAMLGGMLGYFFKLIQPLIEAIDIIISMDLTKIIDAIIKLMLWFAKLFAPLIDLIESFFEAIAKFFNWGAEKLAEFMNICLDFIMSLKSPFEVMNMPNIPQWVKDAYKLIYCVFMLILSFVMGGLTMFTGGDDTSIDPTKLKGEWSAKDNQPRLQNAMSDMTTGTVYVVKKDGKGWRNFDNPDAVWTGPFPEVTPPFAPQGFVYYEDGDMIEYKSNKWNKVPN